MFIENINVKNFRNIEEESILFDRKLNFILGKNAQGKTNIIESIYYLAFLKSFRTNRNSDLIKSDKNFFLLKSNIVNYGVNNKLEIYFSNEKKNICLNEKKPSNYKYLNIVIFHPEEINYISNYPVYRRNFIDRSIFYTNYSYLNIYKKYTKCLKQRNILLKNKDKQADFWKDQLINYGTEIIRERIKYINKINKYFESTILKNINKEKYSVSYSKKYKNNNIENNLYEEFDRKREREYQLGYTLVGPHRDDIVFELNGLNADAFASQGQKRSMIISYKTAQILDYKSVQGHYPVLILDDMTSELDTDRKNNLLENLLENSGQVFITSTNFKITNFIEQSKVFKVNNGKISMTD